MSENTKQTVIENGTEFEGSIKSQCTITLSGKVKGQLQAPALTVTPSGVLQGNVKVGRLKTEGEVAGEIDAESVVLSGRVSDQTVIRAKTLEVTLSQPQSGLQVTFGNCEFQVGDKKTRSDEKTKGAHDASTKEKEHQADGSLVGTR
jgi:cytoskeletal protein CcmA (bactofilin family)